MRARRPDSGPPDPDEKLERGLTWIWGTPRSGSSWLLSLLCHPLRPDPTVPLGFTLPERGLQGELEVLPVDESFLPNHLAPALADPHEVDGRYVAGTLNNYLSAKPTYAFSEEYSEVWRPAVRQLFLARLGAGIERARREGMPVAEHPVLVIKEGNGSHASDVVMDVLRASRMIVLARDGRDVVDSLLSAYQPGGFLARNQGQTVETAEQRLETVEWAARMWASNMDITLRALEAHDDSLGRLVRYEDLLADTAGVLDGLFRWVGRARERRWVEAVASRHSFDALPKTAKGPLRRNRAARPGLWRENLSADEQRRVEEIIGDRLRHFGYED